MQMLNSVRYQIYELTINGKVYVGKSKNPHRRIKSHLSQISRKYSDHRLIQEHLNNIETAKIETQILPYRRSNKEIALIEKRLAQKYHKEGISLNYHFNYKIEPIEYSEFDIGLIKYLSDAKIPQIEIVKVMRHFYSNITAINIKHLLRRERLNNTTTKE